MPSCLATCRCGFSGKNGRRWVCRVSNQKRETRMNGAVVEFQFERKPVVRNMLKQPGCGPPLFFPRRGRSVMMKGRNCPGVSVARIGRRWIGHAVHGSDNDQQTYQTCDNLELHGALEKQMPLARGKLGTRKPSGGLDKAQEVTDASCRSSQSRCAAMCCGFVEASLARILRAQSMCFDPNCAPTCMEIYLRPEKAILKYHVAALNL